MKRYEKYKESGVEWLGKIPEHWGNTFIKNVLEIPITDGPHTTPELIDEGIPFISAEAIKNGKIDFDKKRGNVSESDYELFSKKYIPKLNDIYMVKSGATTGNVAKLDVDLKFTIWSPLAVFRADVNKVIPDFLHVYLQSSNLRNAVEINWSYGTQQNIGMGVLSNLNIPIPTLSEQTQIANFINQKTSIVNQLISEKESLINKLQEKRKALINEVVTKGLNPNASMRDSGIEWLGKIPKHWGINKLKNLLSINDETLSENTPDEYLIRYVEISDVKQELGIHNSTLVSFAEAPSRARRKVKSGDVIISTVRTYLKAIARINDCPDNLIVSTGFAVLRPKLIESNFLGYLMISDGIINEIIRNSVGVSYPAINSSQLVNIQIPVPSTEEQFEIVNFIESRTTKIDATIGEIQLQLQKLREYKTAVISEVVTGKVDVREW